MPLLSSPKYVGVSTESAHVRRALEFAQKTDIYIAIGKTSAWPDDVNLNPEGDDDFIVPNPDPTLTALPEVVGYVKANPVQLVVPDEDTFDVEVYGVKWRFVPEIDAYTEKARRVYLFGEIAYDALPVNISYRMVGAYSGLVKASGVLEGQTILLPADVEDAGVLEYIYNDKPIPRALNRRDKVNVIISF